MFWNKQLNKRLDGFAWPWSYGTTSFYSFCNDKKKTMAFLFSSMNHFDADMMYTVWGEARLTSISPKGLVNPFIINSTQKKMVNLIFFGEEGGKGRRGWVRETTGNKPRCTKRGGEGEHQGKGTDHFWQRGHEKTHQGWGQHGETGAGGGGGGWTVRDCERMWIQVP